MGAVRPDAGKLLIRSLREFKKKQLQMEFPSQATLVAQIRDFCKRLKYDKDTQFKNAASAKEILPDEVITIDYIGSGAENRTGVATEIGNGVTRVPSAALP